jgi:hypothetical protein
MLFDFTLTEANVGEMISPPDAFLVSLTMATSPIYETPTFDEGQQIWTRGYFCLKRERDIRNLVCLDARNGGAFGGGSPYATMLANRSEAYRGQLTVVAVPKGSEWRISLSDVPIVRQPARPDWNFSGWNFTRVAAAPKHQMRGAR